MEKRANQLGNQSTPAGLKPRNRAEWANTALSRRMLDLKHQRRYIRVGLSVDLLNLPKNLAT
jgi:hypothetical protein